MNEQSEAPAPAPAGTGSNALVLRNAMFLLVAQALTLPLSLVVNALMGRIVGPADFGIYYLATTFCGFGFLLVEWGQGGTLPALVAQNRSRGGEFLGSGLAWRALVASGVTSLLVSGAWVTGRDHRFVMILALTALGFAATSASAACQDTLRGFERTDVSAYAQVGTQYLSAVCVAIVLALGGGLPGVLVIQAGASSLAALFVWRSLRKTGVGALRVSTSTLARLARSGVPFFFFGLVMALQPNLDAAFMSRLVPEEVMGWHAAARRLIGVLVYPASAIITALYPTLCRLFVDDPDDYRRTTSAAIGTTTLLAVPLAMGCFLYADIGVGIFGHKNFGPAEDNLHILAGFLFLLYFSMPLGSCLLAGNRQRSWSFVQALCVVLSALLDPVLIPYFQRRSHNGGMGVCISNLVSELLVVGFGIALTPRGVFNAKLLRKIAVSLAAGGAMYLVSRALHGINSLLSAPLALAAYGGCLWLLGGIDEEQIAMFKRMVRRRSRR